MVAGPVDPDHAILGIHFHGDIAESVDALAEIGGDAIDGRYTLNLIDVHFPAASAEPAMQAAYDSFAANAKSRSDDWA